MNIIEYEEKRTKRIEEIADYFREHLPNNGKWYSNGGKITRWEVKHDKNGDIYIYKGSLGFDLSQSLSKLCLKELENFDLDKIMKEIEENEIC